MGYASDSGHASFGASGTRFNGEIITHRAKRMPEHAAENAALLRLLDACANAPETIPRVLVTTALAVCNAGSAVLGLLDAGDELFRWKVVAGALSPFEGIAIPRHESPGNFVLEGNCTELLCYPHQQFSRIPREPLIVEALFAPFKVEERTVGTLWVASHSEDRHFDEESARLLEQLARFAGIAERLHQASEGLKRTEQGLREADHRKDAFLAVLAHELRNPLAPIRNAAHVLSSPRLGPQDLQWARSVISRQVAQMAHLLDDLLDVSRITQNQIRLKLERVELASIVDSAVEAARPLVDGKQHRLSVTLPARPLAFHADPVRLTQVLTNLLRNAAKYTDGGGRIDLTGRLDGDVLVLSVKDSGVGIDEKALGSLFQIFSQVEGTLDRAEGGLGIGLALTKGLVELHGGSIEARSEGVGHGSEFVVRIPLLNMSVPASSGVPQPAVQPPVGGLRVLVADDNRDAAESLAMLLEMESHELRVAFSGQTALSLARAFRPEAAIIDIGMPDMDGYDVARALRREVWGERIMLIALTGWGKETDRERAREAGFDHHLTKPVDPFGIEALLREIARSR